jgi:CBS domain-containing protein
MKARDIMTANPEVVTPEEPVSHAAEIMRDRNVGAVPIVENRSSMRLQGLITDRDIAVRHVAEGHQRDCTVREHMTNAPLDTVEPDADVSKALEQMKRDQFRRIPVTDREGRLLGIIAQADIALEKGKDQPDTVAEVVRRISEPGKAR